MGKVLRRQDDLGDDLVVPQRGLLAAEDEIVDLHSALAVEAFQHEFRVEQDQRLRHVALRRSVADVAADRRAVAQRDRSHAGSGVNQQRMHKLRAADLRGGRQRADGHAAVGILMNAPELLHAGEDQHRIRERGRDACAHALGDHQVRAAREDRRVVFLADFQRFLQGLGHEAFYLFHNAAPFCAASRMDSTIRS